MASSKLSSQKQTAQFTPTDLPYGTTKEEKWNTAHFFSEVYFDGSFLGPDQHGSTEGRRIDSISESWCPGFIVKIIPQWGTFISWPVTEEGGYSPGGKHRRWVATQCKIITAVPRDPFDVPEGM